MRRQVLVGKRDDLPSQQDFANVRLSIVDQRLEKINIHNKGSFLYARIILCDRWRNSTILEGENERGADFEFKSGRASKRKLNESRGKKYVKNHKLGHKGCRRTKKNTTGAGKEYRNDLKSLRLSTYTEPKTRSRTANEASQRGSELWPVMVVGLLPLGGWCVHAGPRGEAVQRGNEKGISTAQPETTRNGIEHRKVQLRLCESEVEEELDGGYRAGRDWGRRKREGGGNGRD